MKHKRLILTTVLLACVAAVVVPFRREIWLAVAYERDESMLTDYGVVLDSPGIYCLMKRAPWLPGAREIYPDQTCGSCLRAEVHQMKEHHAKCRGGSPIMNLESRQIDPALSYRCTCPDPSHEWNR